MFTMQQIGEAILNAVQRGVEVRIISNYSSILNSGSKINELQTQGKFNARNLCH